MEHCEDLASQGNHQSLRHPVTRNESIDECQFDDSIMTPARWQKIESLLQAALECKPAGRGAFLDEACAGDETLRQDVESLLASNEQVDGFLESPALEDAAGLLSHEGDKSMIGLAIGPYTILSQLGVGGMGEVYLASDSRLGRKVALKFLPEYLTDEDRVERFKQEARVASALNHPNVATIYDIGEVGGAIYIAMEYVEGQTLGARRTRQPFDSAELVDIVTQIASALDEAHTRGITHRDIKADNIMLTERGHAKVLDFGLAKIRPSTAEDALSKFVARQTAPGMVMGTVQYMSPEQALGRPLDHRTDIFSLGVVMYEMAAGRLPFHGATPSEMVDQIVHAEPVSIAIARPEYYAPPELERMIRKCLEKEPDRRYQSARDLLIDLKNLKRDTDSGEVAWSVGSTQRAEAAAAVKSIAVLPLRRLGSDESDDYLGVGMADALITRLSSTRRLMVRPTSAVTKYDNALQNALAAGQELAVESVIEGHFRRSAGRMRVTVQLVRVGDGSIIWAGKFDERFTDIFALEDSISEQVADALTLSLTREEKQLLAKRHTENTEAHQAYLKGRYYWNKRTADGLKKGLECFQQALAEDWNYAPAYVGLADSFNLLGNLGHLPPSDAFGRAKQAASRALQLDDSLAEAHASLGYVKWALDWDWTGAEQEYKRAIELDPGYATAHQWYSLFLAGMGRPDEAITEARRAQENDPVSLTVRAAAGMVFYLCRAYDDAIEQCKGALEMDPSFYLAHLYLSWVYDQEGRHEEAIVEARAAVDLSGGAVLPLSSLAFSHVLSGDRSSAKQILTDLDAVSGRTYVPAVYSAVIHTALGETDAAFDWLERAYDERSNWLTLLKVDPKVDCLRSDPRFQDLMRRVGFQP